ncbi:hypothetical protein HELRODRAFT_164744 [Helobdella robusta]|uniref:BTB domain-containing protein n=1 Tax=Helobdella robusta TaxID=6412 RepID=T1EVR7_HELRO|nr:hypothetical protein HELRODRAFT_164744 [Helobdella robusta]ESN92663.1 hypothetical protein HELRODRAFT_164744 [Helobdella robusta]
MIMRRRNTLQFHLKSGRRYEVARDSLLQNSSYYQDMVNSRMRDAHFKELTLDCLSDASLQEVSEFLLSLQSSEEDRSTKMKRIENIEKAYLNDSSYARIFGLAKKYALIEWFEKAPKLTARQDHVMTALGDKIFVVGGNCFATENGLDTVESAMRCLFIYPACGQWTFVLTLKLSFWTAQHSILFNGSLLCFALDWLNHNYVIQKINLKNYLDINISSSNELKKKYDISNATDTEESCGVEHAVVYAVYPVVFS